MKIRSLGNQVKSKTIRDLIAKERVQLLCLQETKKQSISRDQCYMGTL